MTVNFSDTGEVGEITMFDYLHKMIRKLPPEMIGTTKTTAAHLNIYSKQMTKTQNCWIREVKTLSYPNSNITF